MSLHLGCRLMRQSSYSPRCKKLVALGSVLPFAAYVTNGSDAEETGHSQL